MKTRSRIGILAVTGLALAAALALAFRSRGNGARFTTAAIDRGDIADVVGATGLLQAVTTVQVGSQVSGTIKELYADFNSNVKKGQVIARLDPSLFEARVAQAKANLISARADVDRAQAAITDAKQKFERARELAAQNLVPPSDLESAHATYDGALAQHAANKAAVSQAEASLNQAQVDLAHTVIAAPIDGVVLARNVDVGQTVAASFTAPVLFIIANDLTRMQVNASIDEADIGRVRPAQPVKFGVDAYPDATFAGKVEQVRLQPVTNQNVVTYNTIISVDNKDLRLMPGMTATVTVIIQNRENALRLPAPALRFRPEGFEDRRASRGPGGPGAGAGGPGAGAPGAGGGEGQRRRGEGRRSGGDGTARGAGQAAGESPDRPGRPGLVFVPGPDGKAAPARVRLGISDGRFVEVLEGLDEGAPVIVAAADDGARPRAGGASPAPSTNPFTPGRPQFRTR
jgi:HlyD family secretion protein